MTRMSGARREEGKSAAGEEERGGDPAPPHPSTRGEEDGEQAAAAAKPTKKRERITRPAPNPLIPAKTTAALPPNATRLCALQCGSRIGQSESTTRSARYSSLESLQNSGASCGHDGTSAAGSAEESRGSWHRLRLRPTRRNALRQEQGTPRPTAPPAAAPARPAGARLDTKVRGSNTSTRIGTVHLAGMRRRRAPGRPRAPWPGAAFASI